MAPGTVAGRYPSGANVQSASGQGTWRASGWLTRSVPASQRSAWLT